MVNYDEYSKIIEINQDGVMKRYSTSLIRSFIAQPSILDKAIVDRNIEENRIKPTKMRKTSCITKKMCN